MIALATLGALDEISKSGPSSDENPKSSDESTDSSRENSESFAGSIKSSWRELCKRVIPSSDRNRLSLTLVNNAP